MPELAKKCIASWEKYCPDYEIIRWDESNFDLDCNDYIRYCYANKKWAFLSDLVRLMVVYDQGGIYFDTDVELLRSPDELLTNEAFYGWENATNVATGLGFGSVAGHCSVKAMIDQYDLLEHDENGEFPMIVCPKLNTTALEILGLVADGSFQDFRGVRVLPVDWMNPYDDATGRLNKTKNTLSVHWYSKSWLSPGQRLRSKLTKPFHRLFGVNCFAWLKKSK